MNKQLTEKDALNLVRFLINAGKQSPELAVNNSAIPQEYREILLKQIIEEENFILEPANVVKRENYDQSWLNKEDKFKWYYWPALRDYLLLKKGLPNSSVESLDKETDRILNLLASPKNSDDFDIRGLVLGYVQSGKTSNYTALIAKAADSGYKLVIVLTGMDNGLRLQTQKRLKKELVGVSDDTGVELPPAGKQWREYTTDDINGDFSPGYNTASAILQNPQPILMVIKKNHRILQNLISWLESTATDSDLKNTPMLIIDDEGDLASVDTKGMSQPQEEIDEDEYVPPSRINGLIRELLNKFERKAYVAYTATPFANILIPSEKYDPRYSKDLYPKDFIVSLPKPKGYFGAEELFGRFDSISEELIDGLDVIRPVINVEDDLFWLEKNLMPPNMERAILSFILSGAGLAYRKKDISCKFPATMLIHISLKTNEHLRLKKIVEEKFSELINLWNYYRNEGISSKMEKIWNEDFMILTKQKYPEKVIQFEELVPFIQSFFQSIQIRTLNCLTNEFLDYEREPSLKAIAIGGNKLSRGLTLEGLSVSYFSRRSQQYDTLMQMGRWFGFRDGYDDLTRIYTTPELENWFFDLSQVEFEIREKIKIYDEKGLTPLQIGLPILAHGGEMKVTGPQKRKFARYKIEFQDYRTLAPQTILFPLNDLEVLSKREDKNLTSLKEFLLNLGNYEIKDNNPLWRKIPSDKIISFLSKFEYNDSATRFKIPLIIKYISKLNVEGDLVNWTVAIRGLKTEKPELRQVDWGLNRKINQINISQIRTGKDTGKNTLKSIVSQGDEMIGLPKKICDEIESEKKADRSLQKNILARKKRDPKEGLLLIYPISKFSKSSTPNRSDLFDDSTNEKARNLIGLAISFPDSNTPVQTKVYIEGTVSGDYEDEF